MAQDFKKLEVYKDAFDLSKDIYNELKDVTGHFRVKDQLLASSTAICANLAEMAAFDNTNQMKQKVAVCIGEANETDFWLNFCTKVGLLKEEKFKDFQNRIKTTRMKLFNLHKVIKLGA
jgi:four helix bundle protein